MASLDDVSQGVRSGDHKMGVSSDARDADSSLSHQGKEDVGLVEYLRLCKAVAEKGQEYKKVHLVVGSDSCDLDSVVSSLVYAFHLWKVNKDTTTAVIPVLNIPMEDFAVRGEVKMVLEEQGIEQSALLFAQDVDPVRYHRSDALVLTLVDHQKPTGIFAGCQDAVVEVIDHKMDTESQNTNLSYKVKVTVEVAGSCATLIAGMLLTDPSSASALTPLTAQLLYQTIVLDTLNFSPAGRVATPKDLHVAEQLSAMFASRLSREEIFQKLTTAKSDISNLSTELVLRRDIKIVEVGGHGSGMKVAACTIPILTREYFSSEKVQTEILVFCQHTGVVAAVILGTSLQLPTARDMLVYAEQFRVLNKIIYVLQTTPKVFLDLQKSGSFHGMDHRFEHFQLGNSTVTLDVILPVLKEALTSLSNSAKPVNANGAGHTEELDRAVPTLLGFRPVSPPPYTTLNIPDGPVKSPSARSPSRVLDQLKQEDFIPTETPWLTERSVSPRNLPDSDFESEKYGKRTERRGYDVVDGNPPSQLAPEDDNKPLMTPNNTQPQEQNSISSPQQQQQTDDQHDRENEKVIIEKIPGPGLKENSVDLKTTDEVAANKQSLNGTEDGKANETKRSKLDLGWLSSHWEKLSPKEAEIHNPALTDTVDGLEPGVTSTTKSTPGSSVVSPSTECVNDPGTSASTATDSKVTSPIKSPSFQTTSTAAWFTSSGSRPTCAPPRIPTRQNTAVQSDMGESGKKPEVTSPERFPGMSPIESSSPLSASTPDSVTPWDIHPKTDEAKYSIDVPMPRSVSADKTIASALDSNKAGDMKKGTDEVDIGPAKNSAVDTPMNNKPDVVTSSVRYSSLANVEKREDESESGIRHANEERPESRLDRMISPVEGEKKTYPWSTPIGSPQVDDAQQNLKENVSSGEVSPWDFEKQKSEINQGGTVELGGDGGKTQSEMDKEERELWEKELEKVGDEAVTGKDEVDTGRGGRYAGRQLPKTPDAGKHLTERNVEDLPMELHSSDLVVVEDQGKIGVNSKDGRTQNEEDLEDIHFAFRRIADRKDEGTNAETSLGKSEEALTKLTGSENMDSSMKSSSENDKPSGDNNQSKHKETAKLSTKDAKDSKSKALVEERTLSYDETAYPSAGYHILSDSNNRTSKSKSPESSEPSEATTTSDGKVGNADVKNQKGQDAVDGPIPSPSNTTTLNTGQTTSESTETSTANADISKNVTDTKSDASLEKPVDLNPVVDANQADVEQAENLGKETNDTAVMGTIPKSTGVEKPKKKDETLAAIRSRQLEDQRRELFQQHRSAVNNKLDDVLSKSSGLDQVDSGKTPARNGSMDADGEDSGSSTASISSVRKVQPTTSEVSDKKEAKSTAGEKTPMLEKRLSTGGTGEGIEKGKSNEEVYAVDMAAIEPYSAVVSVHMMDNGMFQGALVCFYACYLPRRSTEKYEYLMQNIFRYFVGTLDFLEGRPCMVAYFNGAVPSGSYPTTSWLHQCYKMLDRRMEKNLQGVVIVHPNFWFKAQLQVVGRALVSGGFYHKVAYAETLDDLRSRLELEDADISRMKLPLPVEEYDQRWFKKTNTEGSPMASRRFAILRKCSF